MTNPSEVVLALLRATETLDAAQVARHLADDVAWQNVPFPAARGKKTVTRHLELMNRAVTGVEVRVHHIAANGGVVLTQRTDVIRRGRFEAAFWVCGTFVVRDGRVVLWRDHYDHAYVAGAFLKGLGKLAAGALGRALRRQPVGR
ncbi:limonene-1,2-epoxide hydrolase [Lentzea xinjiangensis]|uniref:Limonene-1,2-epoxide hydrolase n=1 Tax=Lentzea xinjiangensis TaxID=402600 RepID=A0A1H9BXI6_9PSEU|nr:limonene-1,2-epoxide hydrolase family protein [Lentzea xinjiangensis]SEP93098.1 limonene-1,2-epoxide hydrolase [Lentzea xinjiangensis]